MRERTRPSAAPTAGRCSVSADAPETSVVRCAAWSARSTRSATALPPDPPHAAKSATTAASIAPATPASAPNERRGAAWRARCNMPLLRRQLLHLHVPDPHLAAEVVLLEGEVPLHVRVLRV